MRPKNFHMLKCWTKFFPSNIGEGRKILGGLPKKLYQNVILESYLNLRICGTFLKVVKKEIVGLPKE